MKRVMCVWLRGHTQRGARSAVPPREVESSRAGAGKMPAPPGAQNAALVQDRAALVQLALRFSPRVAVEEGQRPECLLLDVTGCERLFHGEPALGEAVLRQFAAHGHAVRIAIADTIGAAWAAAKFGASRIPPGQTAAALEPLPLDALRLSPDLVLLLKQLGVTRIGQLQRLPRASLAARFDPELLRRLDQAEGRLAEVLVPEQLEEPVRADWPFEVPVQRSDVLESVLRQLIQQVARQLEGRQQGAERIECLFYPEQGPPARFAVNLFRPSAQAEHLFDLAGMQLERLRLAAPVAAMRVEAPLVAALECRHPEFFAGSSLGLQSLALLMDRLSSRLGPQAVVQGRLVADAQPEFACHYEPVVGSAGNPPAALPVSLPVSHFLWRPLRIQSPPRPVPVEAASAGPPLRFSWRGQEHQISRSWGPERIETGWWRAAAASRDYYRVETSTGCRYWLFRRLSDGAWFLHGWFE